MMKSGMKAGRRILIGSLLSLLLDPLGGFAEDWANVGFKKDVSKELKQKFSVCDEFLDVKWIDKKRHIGKLKANYTGRLLAEKVDKKEASVLEGRKLAYLLVLADELGSYSGTALKWFFYEINKEMYESTDFDSFLLKATISGPTPVLSRKVAKHGDKKTEFWMETLPFHPMGNKELEMKSFRGFTKNICLLYPEEEGVLIIEEKMPFGSDRLTPELTVTYNHYVETVQRWCRTELPPWLNCDCDMVPLKFGLSLDINNDGIEDYMSRFDSGGECRNENVVFLSKGEGFQLLRMPQQCTGLWALYSYGAGQGLFNRSRLCDLSTLGTEK